MSKWEPIPERTKVVSWFSRDTGEIYITCPFCETEVPVPEEGDPTPCSRCGVEFCIRTQYMMRLPVEHA